MKNVVIISYYFAPLNDIAAIRMTKVAKYLAENSDYRIYAITVDNKYEKEDKLLFQDALKISKIFRIQEPTIISKINKKRIQKNATKINEIETNRTKPQVSEKQSKFKLSLKKLLTRVKGDARQWFDVISQYLYFRNAKKAISKLDFNIDVVISSYGPLSSHGIGSYIKKHSRDCIWIADFRDPVFNWQTPFGLRLYAKNYARRITKNADSVTAVSEGCLNLLNISQSKISRVIPNGYDKEDLARLSFDESQKNAVHDVLTFCYVGRVYPDRSDLRPFFRCLFELVASGSIDKSRIKVLYAGSTPYDFTIQASDEGVSDMVTNLGYLERSKSLALQASSDVLLMASWNRKESNGIVTGKFLEYMMIGKPILALISGNLKCSLVKNIICEGDLGFCYEEANHDQDYAALKKYIIDRYNELTENGFVTKTSNPEVVDSYDYRIIAQAFSEQIEVTK